MKEICVNLVVAKSNTSVEENLNDQQEELETVTSMDIDFAPLIPNRERSFMELPSLFVKTILSGKFK